MRALGNRYQRRGIVAVLAVIMVWSGAGPASAHGTVDQVSESGYQGYFGERWGQSVTPAADNLAAVDLNLYQVGAGCSAPDRVSFDLVVRDGTTPDGPVLVRQGVEFTPLGTDTVTWLHVEFDSPLPTTPGSPFFLEIPDRALSDQCLRWQLSFWDPYAGGMMWTDHSGTFEPYVRSDLLFRTYSVDQVSLRERNRIQAEELAALSATHPDDKYLAKASEHQGQSTADAWWADEDHVDPDDGDEVFKQSSHAVRDLAKVETAGASDAIDATIAELVDIDRSLAVVLIDEARAAIDSSDADHDDLQKARDKLADAEEELARGDAERDAEEPSKAIDRYRKAWERALDALERVAEI